MGRKPKPKRQRPDVVVAEMDMVPLLLLPVFLGVLSGGDDGARLVGAATRGDIRTVRRLLAKGVKPDAADAHKQTGMMLAAAEGHLALVRVLLDAGAAVDAKNELGATALMLAGNRRHLEVVKELLQRGASVNVVAERNLTPLLVSLSPDRNGFEIWKLLIGAGADVNAQSTDGESALIVLAKAPPPPPGGLFRGGPYLRDDLAELLLKAGARTDLKDRNGETALSIAERLHNNSIAAILRRAAAEQKPH